MFPLISSSSRVIQVVLAINGCRVSGVGLIFVINMVSLTEEGSFVLRNPRLLLSHDQKVITDISLLT